MAYMIPEAVPHGRPNSEKRVFSTLQGLPEDCWVYFEPLIAGRYPDFIVFIPDCGLLVVEVKGWHPQTILGGDDRLVQLRANVAANPIRQARDYMLALMDRCRRHPAGERLIHRDGPRRGQFIFPFGYLAILSEITDLELRGHPSGDLRQFLPSAHVVTADEFDEWADLAGTSLKHRLAAFFDPRWPLALAPDQVDALRTIIHPEVVVPRTPNEIAIRAATPQLALPLEDAASLETIRSMDLEQERQARTIGAGHRLLFGVAGSGKTIVLIARARFLSEALPQGRILVLCFNVPFKSYLAAVLVGCPNVDVYTFHGWGASNGVPWRPGQRPEEYGARLLEALDNDSVSAAAYDAVLIDEAQDFEPTWFQCVSRAMKEPRHGDLLIVGDRNQTNYKLGRISWKALGIEAKGRSRILRRNYRNTRPIQAAAAAFSETDEAKDGIPATACEPTTAWRDSQTLPALLKRPTRLTELQSVFDLVQGLLVGSFLDTRIPPLRPEEIGLLYRKNEDSGLLEAVVENLSRLAPVIWLTQPRPATEGGGQSRDNRQRVLEPGIKLQTIHSAKGLQYRAVVLMFADQLGAGALDPQEERRLLYVALTRPEDVLAVTCSVAAHEPPPALLGELLNSPAFREA